MDIDGAGLDIDVRAPDRIQQLLARKDPAGMLDQMIEGRTLQRPRILLKMEEPAESAGIYAPMPESESDICPSSFG